MKIPLYKSLMVIFNFTLIALFCDSSIGQTTENIKILQQKFATADSIVLISHDITEEYAVKIIPDWDNRDTSMNLKKWNALHPIPPRFLIDGKLNRQIIKEAVYLSDSDRVRLSKILLRKVNLNYWAPSRCDQPQHSIIFYKSGTQSYMDICFGCGRIHSSKDIAFDEMNVDKNKWKELMAFFKSNGLTKIFEEEEHRVSE